MTRPDVDRTRGTARLKLILAALGAVVGVVAMLILVVGLVAGGDAAGRLAFALAALIVGGSLSGAGIVMVLPDLRDDLGRDPIDWSDVAAEMFMVSIFGVVFLGSLAAAVAVAFG